MTTDELQTLERIGADRLRRRYRNLSRQDREEVLQDALIAIVRQGGNDPALLSKIIHDKAVDRTRKLVRRAKVEQPTPDMSAVSPAVLQTFDDLVFTVTLDQTVRGLPQELRDSFILMDLRGLTSYEASALLDRPASTIRNHRNEARNIIREELQ
jgi:DNA-directed RNA polymerase specialized sigma24 family protein